jgi:hypothetical protein
LNIKHLNQRGASSKLFLPKQRSQGSKWEMDYKKIELISDLTFKTDL